MRHMVPCHKKTAFRRGWEGGFWWPCCTGEVVRGGQPGWAPPHELSGRAGSGAPLPKRPHAHTPWRGSACVALAPRVLVGFNPQTPCHGSKEASGDRAPRVAAAACPGQAPAPPEGFVPPVSQELALWRLQLLQLQLPVLPGKGLCKGWSAGPQLGNVLLPAGASAPASCRAAPTLFHTSVGKIPLLMI